MDATPTLTESADAQQMERVSFKDRLKRRMDGLRGEHGFSMVELAFVILIIGVIAAIAIPNLSNARDSANEAHAQAAASNASAKIVSELAFGNPMPANFDELAPATITVSPSTGATLADFCVTASYEGQSATKGPTCP